MTYHFNPKPSDLLVVSSVRYRACDISTECILFENADQPGIIESFTHEQLSELLRSPDVVYRPGYFDWADRNCKSRQEIDVINVLCPKKRDTVLWKKAVCDTMLRLEAEGRLLRTDSSYRDARFLLQAEVSRLDGSGFENQGAKRAGDIIQTRKLPCSRTAFQMLRTYIESGFDPLCFVPQTGRSGNRGLRWCHETEAMISRVIEIYGDVQRPTKSAAIKKTIADIKAENRSRKAAQQDLLHVPSKRAVAERLNRADPYYIYSKRHGIAAANRKFNLYENGVDVVFPLERIEMDEVKLDVISLLASTGLLEYLSPERRKALERGRRWLYVAIDCATKVIVAMRLAKTPSAKDAILTLRDVYADKSAIAEACGCSLPWKEHGAVGIIATDHGSAFISSEFRAVAVSLGITLQYPPGGLPWMRGQIESFFRTLGHQLMPLLSGRTFFSPDARGDYPSEQLACLSDDDLIRILVTFVVDIYHSQPHGSLNGETPRDCWDRLVTEKGTLMLPDGHVMRKAFGRPFLERKIHGNGVRFAGISYNCDALKEAFKHSPERKVEIRVDLRDLGWISVKVSGIWHAATANQSGFDGISYDAYKEATRALRIKHLRKAELNQELIQNAFKRISETNLAAMSRMDLTPFHVSDDEILRNEATLHFSLRSKDEHSNISSISSDPLADGMAISPKEIQSEREETSVPSDVSENQRKSTWGFDDE